MLLPNRDLVVVADAKCTKYLLDLSHPDGAPKARFFLGHGFSRDEWHVLQAALKRHPLDNEVASFRQFPSPARVHYEVRCNIGMPDGKPACIKTIWVIHADDPAPQFVTAYPA